MAKPRKKSKGRQKSKAAQVTADKRAERNAAETPSHGEAVEYTGSGGMMTRMRGGFQSAVGNEGEGSPKGGWLSTVLWIAVIGAGAFFMMGNFR